MNLESICELPLSENRKLDSNSKQNETFLLNIPLFKEGKNRILYRIFFPSTPDIYTNSH